MSAFAIALRLEILKLRRTLALALCLVAPLLVVVFQAALWLRRKEGLPPGLDPWVAFHLNAFSMWAIFMQPLTVALAVALVYQVEHANHGWLRMGALPIPRSAAPAAKAFVCVGLSLLATLVLAAGCAAGTLVAAALHPVIEVRSAPPLALLAARTARCFAASLLVLAIQNAVSSRWASLVVPLGTGVGGTFFALFGFGWKYGPYYPWLLPAHALHGAPAVAGRVVVLGCAGGLLVLAASVFADARRDPGNR
jgi:hypothetical protein